MRCEKGTDLMRFRLRHFLATLALFTGMMAHHPASAQIELGQTGLTLTLTPTASTDYTFRGVSQTRNRPAIQGLIDIQHTSGFYVGAFASNVSFKGLDARQEVDMLGGYRFTSGGLALDGGFVWYNYPGYSSRTGGGLDMSFFEFAGKVSYEIAPVKVLGSFYYSPDFQLDARNAYYVEGGVEVKMPLDVTLAGRYGYQWIDRNVNYGLPDFGNWSVALSRSFYGALVTVGYYDTDVKKRECGGGQKICDARAMVSLSYTF